MVSVYHVRSACFVCTVDLLRTISGVPRERRRHRPYLAGLLSNCKLHYVRTDASSGVRRGSTMPDVASLFTIGTDRVPAPASTTAPTGVSARPFQTMLRVGTFRLYSRRSSTAFVCFCFVREVSLWLFAVGDTHRWRV